MTRLHVIALHNARSRPRPLARTYICHQVSPEPYCIHHCHCHQLNSVNTGLLSDRHIFYCSALFPGFSLSLWLLLLNQTRSESPSGRPPGCGVPFRGVSSCVLSLSSLQCSPSPCIDLRSDSSTYIHIDLEISVLRTPRCQRPDQLPIGRTCGREITSPSELSPSRGGEVHHPCISSDPLTAAGDKGCLSIAFLTVGIDGPNHRDSRSQ